MRHEASHTLKHPSFSCGVPHFHKSWQILRLVWR